MHPEKCSYFRVVIVQIVYLALTPVLISHNMNEDSDKHPDQKLKSSVKRNEKKRFSLPWTSSKKYHVAVLHNKFLSLAEIYVQYHFIHNSTPRIRRRNSNLDLQDHSNLISEFYDEGVINLEWNEVENLSSSEIGIKKTFVVKDEKRQQLTCSTEWRVADEKNIKSIAFAVFNRLLQNEDFKDAVINGREFQLKESDKVVLRKAGVQKTFNHLVSYSKDLVEGIKDKPKNSVSNPLVDFKKNEANEFARSMGAPLASAWSSGFHSTRQVAKYFNDNGILSASGRNWSANAVLSLLKRRKKLGLSYEDESDEKQPNLDFEKSMGKHLKEAQEKGISTTRKIAEYFNKMGISTKTGKDWSNVTIHNLIKKREEYGLD